MESIEQICESNNSPSWIQILKGNNLYLSQNNIHYDVAFGHKRYSMIGLKTLDIPFNVAQSEQIKQNVLKEDKLLLNQALQYIENDTVMNDGEKLTILKNTRKPIYKYNSDRNIIAIYNESKDITSNYSPMYLYTQYLNSYKSADEATILFLKYFGAYNFFNAIPHYKDLMAMILRANAGMNCEYLANHCNISLAAFKSRLARLKECLYSKYQDKDSIHVLYVMFNHALNQPIDIM